jgi:FkbM family methyltransferase
MRIGEAARMLGSFHRLSEILTAHRRAEDWRRLSLRYLGLVHRPFPYELTLRDGVRFRFECREEVKVFWNIFIRSTYHVAHDDRLIFDAGANIGMFAVWAARIAPRARVFSLEPWPSTFERLNRHIEINGLADRVVTANVALAGDTGLRRLIGSETESCSNRIQLDRTLSAEEGRSPAGELIACRTLEAALDDFGIDTLDLLKMDIEGSEHETLLASPPSVLRRIKRIDLEYHEVAAHLGFSRDRLFAHLAEAGHIPVSVVEDPFRTGIALFRQTGCLRERRGAASGS